MDPTPYHHPNFSLCSYLVSRLHRTLSTLGLLLTPSVILPLECFLSTYKSSRLVSDLYPVSTESRLLSFRGDLVFSKTFVLSCGCRALQLSRKHLEMTARTQFSPLSPMPCKGERSIHLTDTCSCVHGNDNSDFNLLPIRSGTCISAISTKISSRVYEIKGRGRQVTMVEILLSTTLTFLR